MGGKEIWAFVFLLGVFVFNWPLLGIFGSSLPYMLYVLWALLIFCIWLLDSIDSGEDNS